MADSVYLKQDVAVLVALQKARPFVASLIGAGQTKDHRLPCKGREVLGGAQGTVDTRRGNFQGIGTGEGIELIHDVVDPGLSAGQLFEADTLRCIDVDTNGRGLLGSHQLYRDDLDAFGLSARSQGV